MKTKVLILLMALLPIFGFTDGLKQNNRNNRKETESAKFEKEFKKTKEMLKNRNFVLEADYLQDKYGNRVMVDQTINFVKIDSGKAVIQIGSNYRLGPNGVGGVTAKGNITKWDLSEDKKHESFYLQVNIMTSIGFYDIHFSIGGEGDATALVTGLGPGRLTFDGELRSLNDSAVFEGQSI